MIKPFKISLPGPQDILAKYAIEVMLLRVGSTVLYLSADFLILVTTLLTQPTHLKCYILSTKFQQHV